MQRSFDVAHPQEKHFPALKKLWADVFGDSPEVIDNFFNKTAKCGNIFCVFSDGEPVSALYAIDATIVLDGAEYKSYYVYAVCTRSDYRGNKLSSEAFSFLEMVAKQRGISYLFLVPAEESLFRMYEKLGFSIGFTCNTKTVYNVDLPEYKENASPLLFEDYKNYRGMLKNIPYAILQEDGFNSFYKPVGNDINCVAIKNKGFVIYETENGKVTVHEIFGDEKLMLSAVFWLTGAFGVSVHKPATENGKPYAMLKSLDGSKTFRNGFFGVAYGG